MATRARPSPIESFDQELVDVAVRRVRTPGVCAASKLLPKGLSRNAQARFFEALAQRGLERTGTKVRVPVDEQLKSLLASEPSVALQKIDKRLGGVTGPEAKRAVSRIIAAGVALIVVRGGKELLAVPSGAHLAEAELDQLRETVSKLTALVKSAAPKRGAPKRTLHRDDVAALIHTLPAGPMQKHEAPATARDVLEASLRDRADPSTGLVHIPRFIRALAPIMPAEQVRRGLLEASNQGWLELRPESGVGLLSAEDANLCPRGVRGVVLSWARLKGNSGSGSGGTA